MIRSITLLTVLLFSGQVFSEERTVFLVSLDGFAASYVRDSSLKNFAHWKEEGVYADLQPAFPSLTYPNHMTLATGCPPGKHGVVANRFHDKKRGEFDYSDDPSWLECEPIWVTAERQKTRAAVVYWPQSYSAWNGSEATYHLRRYYGRWSNKKILGKLTGFALLPKKKRPQLLITRLMEPDHTGHRNGPRSTQVKKRVRQIDRELKEFFSRIDRIGDLGPYAVVLVSDHGMAKQKGAISVPKSLPGIPVISGPLLFFYAWDPTKPLPEFPGAKTYTAKNFPSEWGPYHHRMGDMIALADYPKVFRKWIRKGKKEKERGAHGFDPSHPSMAGIFLAWGDGITEGKRDKKIRAIDVAATVSSLLGIRPPKDNVGKPLKLK